MIKFKSFEHYKNNLISFYSKKNVIEGLENRLLEYSLLKLGSKEDYDNQVNELRQFYNLLFKKNPIYIKKIKHHILNKYTLELYSDIINIQANIFNSKVESLYISIKNDSFYIFIEKNVKLNYTNFNISYLKENYFQEQMCCCNINNTLKEDFKNKKMNLTSNLFINKIEKIIFKLNSYIKIKQEVLNELNNINIDKITDFYDLVNLKYDIQPTKKNNKKKIYD